MTRNAKPNRFEKGPWPGCLSCLRNPGTSRHLRQSNHLVTAGAWSFEDSSKSKGNLEKKKQKQTTYRKTLRKTKQKQITYRKNLKENNKNTWKNPKEKKNKGKLRTIVFRKSSELSTLQSWHRLTRWVWNALGFAPRIGDFLLMPLEFMDWRSPFFMSFYLWTFCLLLFTWFSYFLF